MRNYIIKRLLLNIVILFFVALVIYTILRLIPTSYIENLAREKASLPGSNSYKEWLEQHNVL